MKLFVGDRIPTIHIYIDVEHAISNVAASEFVEMTHPSIKKKFKKSDEWLKQVNDLARSIISFINGRHFKLIKAAPSKKSYTYYIRFQPIGVNGEVLGGEFQFQLELRDHASGTHIDNGMVNDDIVVRAIYLENIEYTSRIALLTKIKDALTEMQKGNIDAFFDISQSV